MTNRWLPMTSTSALLPALGGAAALCFAFGISSAFAADKCAAYGPGFTSVDGSETCVRIGGHVRVEVGNGNLAASANSGWAASGAPIGGAKPASLHSASDDNNRLGPLNGEAFPRAHVRLPQGAISYADPR